MESYEELLKRARHELPEAKGGGERFMVPSVDSAVTGNQTIIKNFVEICAALRREPRHLLKWFSKETAAPARIEGGRAAFQAKIPQKALQTKLEGYVKEFVICRECGRPDTRLERTDRISRLVCEACGARASVKQV